MKVIKFNTENKTFMIPALDVAKHRANYYICVVDKEVEGSHAWWEEVKTAMEDEYMLIDWLKNNTDMFEWEDRIMVIDNISPKHVDLKWTDFEDFRVSEAI